jgi:hypothetical protein
MVDFHELALLLFEKGQWFNRQSFKERILTMESLF